jgi:hypothetical protein
MLLFRETEITFLTTAQASQQRKFSKAYALWRRSSDTDNLFLPLALLAAKILLPLAVDMRSRNPCLFLLLR